MKRQLHLGLFIYPAGHHIAAWRHPGVDPREIAGIDYYMRAAQTAERGKFDLFFVGDMLAARERDGRVIREGGLNNIDSISITSAIAAATECLGLVATLSTTYNEPYYIAERFASLDHISNGRAGWNVVTTANPDAALNFGLTEQVEHDERYRRAREFQAVVTGLWDSWADDAWRHDQASGIFFDPEKMHVLGHQGQYLSVRGPLNIARPVQGWPVIVQAGASEAGRQIAAETAEVVFGSSRTIDEARAFYRDVKARVTAAGRSADHVKILPGALVIVGHTSEEAQQKKVLLDSLVHPESGVPNLSIRLGIDASRFDLDAPLPEIPPSNQSQSGRDTLEALARRKNLTVRQLAQLVGGFGGLEMVGTAAEIADMMQSCLETDACDGCNIMFPTVPAGLDDFVALVIPELQRRGLFRSAYEGTTLRAHLGLPRPENQFFPPR